MSNSDLLAQLTDWHQRYLVVFENGDRLQRAMTELAFEELAVRLTRAGRADQERKTKLAKYRAARDAISRAHAGADWVPLDEEAEGLLARAVDASNVTYRLGVAGEEAFEHVRDARAGKRTWAAGSRLSRLIEDGRLLARTTARCAKCGVARPVEDLDVFTSATSRAPIYACHGQAFPPPDRLGLAPWVCWTDTWGRPCDHYA